MLNVCLNITAQLHRKQRAYGTLKAEKDRQSKIKARERMATTQAALVSISK